MTRRNGEQAMTCGRRRLRDSERERGFRDDRDQRETRSLEDRDIATHVPLFDCLPSAALTAVVLIICLLYHPFK